MARNPSPGRRVAASGEKAWLLMLGDLFGLLLAFFVLLHAMSSVPQGRWQAVQTSLTDGFDAGSLPPLEPVVAVGDPLDYVASLIEARRATDPWFADIELVRGEDQLLLRWPRALLFEASGGLRPDRRAGLATLAQLLNRIDNTVAVGADREDWRRGLDDAAWFAKALADAGYERPVERLAYSYSRSARMMVILRDRGRIGNSS